jgi:murein peptide amidase A
MIAVAQETHNELDIVSRKPRRSISSLLAPLHHAAQGSQHLLECNIGEFHHGADRYTLPRFIFNGPRGGGEPIHLGVFAGIHGDEPEGVLAIVRFLGELAAAPSLASGYRIYAYPIANPTGFEENTRHSRRGKDLNREFWRASDEPEVYLLEQELWTHKFHGIVSLHSDDTSEGLYGFVRGPDLSKDLLQPALWAAEKYLHRNTRLVIDGFRARQGLIDGGYAGILSAPPEAQPTPFELTFETPQHAPLHLQVEAHVAALHCILAEYRTVVSIAQHI